MTIPNGSPTSAKELQLIIERAQRIEGEIEELKLDLKDVFNEAKARGFDSPTIKAVMKWMKKDKNKRNEEAALFEVYLAALGHGESSLSDMARDWLQGKRGAAAIPAEDADGQINAFPTRPTVDTDFGDDTADEPISVEQAAKMGAEAAQAGRPVTVNPFRAGDQRRVAWDKAWCSHLGSDGMDIPAELKPTPKPKKGDDDAKGDDE